MKELRVMCTGSSFLYTGNDDSRYICNLLNGKRARPV